MHKKLILVIMDGWGIARNPEVSAIHTADTPFFDAAMRERPHALLHASEEPVGLPAGQMGNSEVGHMNIGAGRIVYQDLVRISKEIKTGAFAEIAEYRRLVAYCKDNQRPLHLLGLLSDGGVHAHIDHLKGILSLLAQEKDFPPVYVHVFTDGRDTDPNAGLDYVRELEQHMSTEGVGRIASVIGRYYAMDRNHKWGRIRKAYDLLMYGVGAQFRSAGDAIRAAYKQEISDEFIKPSVIVDDDGPVAKIEDGDAILFYNYRTDRGRQLTTVLTQEDMREYNMHTRDLYYCTMTRYDDTFEGIRVMYDKEDIRQGLGEVLAENGKQQLRIAETEKYPHVTFFFNGGREEPYPGEKREVCPSPRVATYDLQPEMSAHELRDKTIAELEAGETDFVCLNFANPDMVGHTGIFDAAVRACETVDACTKAVVEAALRNGYMALVTADHGNVDCMRNADGSPHTAHTTAQVPFIFFDPAGGQWAVEDGKLGDIAPTILSLMGLDIPAAMTGDILISPQ